jgi:Fur-regulated basic protein B
MKKKKMNFIELIKKNKEELLKDPQQLAKIEERLDERHSKIQLKP